MRTSTTSPRSQTRSTCRDRTEREPAQSIRLADDTWLTTVKGVDCILSPARANNEIVLRQLTLAGIEISVRHDLPDGCTLFVCENGALAGIRPHLEDYA